MTKLKIQSELYGNIQINILIRKRDDYFEVQVRLIDNGYDTILDTDGCQVGDLTTFQSVAVNLESGIIRQLIMIKIL